MNKSNQGGERSVHHKLWVTTMREIEEDINNGQILHAYELEDWYH